MTWRSRISERWDLVRIAATGTVLAFALSASAPARAEESGSALHIRVRPSGYGQPTRETLEQKVARRTREEFRFRSICRGCLPAEVEARLDALRDPSPLLRGPPEPATAGTAVGEEAAPALAARPDGEAIPPGGVSPRPEGGGVRD